jgi:hypothetical protein
VSSRDRPAFAEDLAGAVAQARVDPRLEGRALQDAIRQAIATRRGSFPQDFYGKTLEEALAWCLVWLMAPEIGVWPFRL